MRRIALILALVCAVLSGWTPVMAQLRGLHAPSAMQDGGHGDGHGGGHGHAGIECPDQRQDHGCKHPAKTVHPTLCSACFAVAPAASVIDRIEIPGRRLLPEADRPLAALDLQPRAPPPRDALPV